LDILFQIGGARVSIVKKDPTILKRLKEVGLTAVYFGIESGSNKMLKVMEKNASKAENIEAIKKCSDAGIFTVIQLVIGMPGENDFTISETIDFIKQVTGELPFLPRVAVNYLQALPGTLCYEFLRHNDLLDKTIENEEKYLLSVSDIDAGEFRQYLNVSEESLPRVKLWRIKIHFLPMIHWLKLHGWKIPPEQKIELKNSSEAHKGVRSRVKTFLKNRVILYRMISFMGEWFWGGVLAVNRCSIYGLRRALLILIGLAKEEDRSQFKIEAQSLRDIAKTNRAKFNATT
jgi:radical SAM superfamily enzyme YgiQ (UPF0313 family)